MPLRLARCVRLRRGLLASASSALVVAGVAVAPEAHAGDPCRAAPLVSTCINADNLWPHPGAQVFATVGGVETVEPGKFGFALVTDYLSRPIGFNLAPFAPGGATQYAIDNQVNGNFLWAAGLTRRLELDFALPVTFGQSGSGAAPITGSTVQLHETAMRDLRFGAAYQIVSHRPAAPNEPEGAFGLTARFEVSAPTGDRDQYAGDTTAVFSPSLAADYRNGRWFAGLEIGGRIRPDAQAQGQTVGPQATVALGIGYDLLRREKLLGVMLEARALPTFATQYVPDGPSGTQVSSTSTILVPSEWMLSVRSSPLASDDVSITLGGGGGIASGDITEPRFRFLLGLRYAPTGGKRLHESGLPTPTLGLGAKQDRCKDDPDSVDGFKDDDGCPDEDADKDGIDDRYDRCPLEAEDFTGPTEGCPEAKPPAPATTPDPATPPSPQSPNPPVAPGTKP
jgi:OOP family OmpA-OmpF porin